MTQRRKHAGAGYEIRRIKVRPTWPCESCTFVNSHSARTCQLCNDGRRPVSYFIVTRDAEIAKRERTQRCAHLDAHVALRERVQRHLADPALAMGGKSSVADARGHSPRAPSAGSPSAGARRRTG
jgi:hypothetical protein